MIPRRLHQFWDSGEPPDAVRDLMATWASLNPEWEHRLWSDDATLGLIDERFDQRVRDGFRQCAIPAMRADLARYLILHAVGGLYADADLSCLRPMEQVVSPTASVIVFRGWNGVWRTDFMASVPGHAALAEIVETSLRNIEARSSNNVWQVTGPGMTTSIIERNRLLCPAEFQTFEFNEVKAKILTFHHALDYRSDGKHWAEVQKTVSIFRDI